MKAIIKLDIPDFQIGQEVCVSFPDTMMIIGITEVATDTVEELEKIKAEFEEDKYILLNQTTAIKVIDRRISELKGEQK